MTETQTEERKEVIDYWAKSKTRRLYDDIGGSIDFKDDSTLPYNPTAILAKAPPNTTNTNQQPIKRFSIFRL